MTFQDAPTKCDAAMPSSWRCPKGDDPRPFNEGVLINRRPAAAVQKQQGIGYVPRRSSLMPWIYLKCLKLVLFTNAQESFQFIAIDFAIERNEGATVSYSTRWLYIVVHRNRGTCSQNKDLYDYPPVPSRRTLHFDHWCGSLVLAFTRHVSCIVMHHWITVQHQTNGQNPKIPHDIVKISGKFDNTNVINAAVLFTRHALHEKPNTVNAKSALHVLYIRFGINKNKQVMFDNGDQHHMAPDQDASHRCIVDQDLARCGRNLLAHIP